MKNLFLIFLFNPLLLLAQKPNVVIIYTDDVGYGDLSCYGATSVKTPNTDRLAKEGLQFTNAHSPAATCTPSRYALLTGEYAWRRKGTGIAQGDSPMIITPERYTLADLFKNTGYTTAAVGKWHLGLGAQGSQNWNGVMSPGLNDIGFDYSYIMAATGDRTPCVFMENQRIANLDPNDPIEVSYLKSFEGELTGKNNPERLKMHPSHGHDQFLTNGISRIGYMRGGKSALWVDENIADSITTKAVKFIENNKNKPFFLYFATNDIHVPRAPHARFVGKTNMGARGDAIVEMDWSVGQILATLDKLGLTDNTIIIFTSDNGPVVDDGYKDEAVERLGNHKPAGILRGGKYSTFEAGTRVPFIIRYPKRAVHGTTNALVSQIDIMATFASFLNQKLPENAAPDSFDEWQAWSGKNKKGRKYLIASTNSGTLTITKDNWKYIEPSKGAAYDKFTNIELGNSPTPQLYNLKKDIGEKENVAAAHKKRVAALEAALNKVRNIGSKPISLQKPNIILFFIDDMGWQDCSVPFYKEKTKWNNLYKTPNLEKLAAQGMKCTNAYASPVCSPSRVSLMTGMNVLNHKVSNWTLRKNQSNDGKSAILTPPQWNMNGISPVANVENAVQATTLPMILKQNGYTTIHVGKAHLGAEGTLGSNPLNLGFDVNIAGHAAGAPQSYYGLDKFGKGGRGDSIWAVPDLEQYWGKDIFLSEALTLEAKQTMDRALSANKPFFLHFAHYAIHTPIMADKRFVQKYYDMGLDSAEAKYASMIEGMDKSLGDIMQYLEEKQLDKNTIVIFLSDNGGLSATARGGVLHQHNTPLRSGKGSAYEGGMRIPFIVKWAGAVQPNSVNNQNFIIEDIFPTVLSMAGIKDYKTTQNIDGQDITPIFKENENNNNRLFYWHYPHVWGPKARDLEFYSVIRQGAWKLIYFHADQKFELYNTEKDISETQNLIESHKAIAIKLAKKLSEAMRKSKTEMPVFIKDKRKVAFPDAVL